MKNFLAFSFFLISFSTYSAEVPIDIWGGLVWNSSTHIGYYAECTEWKTNQENETLCEKFKIKSFTSASKELIQDFNLKEITSIHTHQISFNEMELNFKFLNKEWQDFFQFLLARQKRGAFKIAKNLSLNDKGLRLFFDYSLWPGNYRLTPSFQDEGVMTVTKDFKIYIYFSYTAFWFSHNRRQLLDTAIYTGSTFQPYAVNPIFESHQIKLVCALHPIGHNGLMVHDGHYFVISEKNVGEENLGEIDIRFIDIPINNVSLLKAKRIL